jgi:YD repeat-containing protein
LRTPTKIDVTYDDAGRLTREKLMAGGSPIWDEQYGFDDVGNRTSLTDASASRVPGDSENPDRRTVRGLHKRR